MRVIHPVVGQDIGSTCRMAYMEVNKTKEPIVMCFNEVTIMFTHDSEGFHHPDHNIDAVEVEFKRGITKKDLLKPILKAKQTTEES